MGGIRTNGLFTTATKSLFPTSTPGHKDSPGRRYTTDIQAEGDQHGWQQQQHNNTATQQHNNTADKICDVQFAFLLFAFQIIFLCAGARFPSVAAKYVRRGRGFSRNKNIFIRIFLPARKNLNTIWKYRRSLGCCNSQVIAWLSVSPRWTWCQAASRSFWAIKGRV